MIPKITRVSVMKTWDTQVVSAQYVLMITPVLGNTNAQNAQIKMKMS